MFVGQIERGTIGREAFQEVDYKAMFGYAAKR
jgi:acetolactate synthase-1/2/3 large subunit